jgi:hypothetical protein
MFLASLRYDVINRNVPVISVVKVKVNLSLYTLHTRPEGSRSLRLLDFDTFGTWRRQVCQPYAWTTFNPHSAVRWINEEFQLRSRESNPRPSGFLRSPSSNCVTTNGLRKSARVSIAVIACYRTSLASAVVTTISVATLFAAVTDTLSMTSHIWRR